MTSEEEKIQTIYKAIVFGEQKEMCYIDVKIGNHSFHETLAEGYCCGLPFAIVSYGTHPCCYLGIPKRLAECDVNCHHGVSYESNDFPCNKYKVSENEIVIGWDYAHMGDQYGTRFKGRRYTTKFLLMEIEDVVSQIYNRGRIYI